MPPKKSTTNNENKIEYRIDVDLLSELDRRRGEEPRPLYMKRKGEEHLMAPDNIGDRFTRIEEAIERLEALTKDNHDKLGAQVTEFFAEIFFQMAQYLHMHAPLRDEAGVMLREEDILSRVQALNHFGKRFERYMRKG